MSPSEMPRDKRVKYSGPKKEKSNLLIDKFLKFDMLFHFFYLFEKSSGRIGGGEDADLETINDEEMAL